jgi:AcrR family transcriptional regulator
MTKKVFLVIVSFYLEVLIMAKAFTEEEKEIIRQKLIYRGMELVSEYGLRKVSVEDITKAVGISKGAFYSFFSSKEEFFFQIFEAFEHQVKDQFLIDIFAEGKDKKDSLKEFITRIFDFMDYIALEKFMNPEDLQYLVRSLSQERIQQHFSNDDDFATMFYEKYSSQGIFREFKPEVVSGFFRALVYVRIHKKEIGEKIYPEVMKLFIDMMAEYFIK